MEDGKINSWRPARFRSHTSLATSSERLDNRRNEISRRVSRVCVKGACDCKYSLILVLICVLMSLFARAFEPRLGKGLSKEKKEERVNRSTDRSD